MSAGSSILVGCVGPVAWVQVNGSADHENAGCIKAFLQTRFAKGWRQFVINLEFCRGIDSTFIGMLYRLAADIEESGASGGVDVINPGERNARSISKLGLDALIRIDRDGTRWRDEQKLVEKNIAQPLDCPAPTKSEKTEVMLDAHEALIEANEENRSKFCDVVEFLRRDLEAQTTEG